MPERLVVEPRQRLAREHRRRIEPDGRAVCPVRDSSRHPPAGQLVQVFSSQGDIMQAYDTFEHAAREGALKVILNNDARG